MTNVLIYVKARDHATIDGGATLADILAEPCFIEAVGWIEHEDADVIVLASHRTFFEEAGGRKMDRVCRAVIPKGTIVERRLVQRVETGSTAAA